VTEKYRAFANNVRRKSLCFQLFVDRLDISSLVSAQSYVTEDSVVNTVAVLGGDEVTEDSGLTISGVQQARDEGAYTCFACNVAGNRSMTAYLAVNGMASRSAVVLQL